MLDIHHNSPLFKTAITYCSRNLANMVGFVRQYKFRQITDALLNIHVASPPPPTAPPVSIFPSCDFTVYSLTRANSGEIKIHRKKSDDYISCAPKGIIFIKQLSTYSNQLLGLVVLIKAELLVEKILLYLLKVISFLAGTL